MVSFAATQIFFSRLRATICAVLVIPFGRQGVTASTFVQNVLPWQPARCS
jgi:hypothetical protein